MILMSFGVNVKPLYIVVWAVANALFIVEKFAAVDDERERFWLMISPMAGELFSPIAVLGKRKVGVGFDLATSVS